jgi:hypothetical protein
MAGELISLTWREIAKWLIYVPDYTENRPFDATSQTLEMYLSPNPQI